MALMERKVIAIKKNDQVRPLVVAVVFAAFATLSVILRLVAKRLVQPRFGIDDYMILIALVRRKLTVSPPKHLDAKTWIVLYILVIYLRHSQYVQRVYSKKIG